MPGPVGQVGLAVDGVGAKSGLFGRQFWRPGDDRRTIYEFNTGLENRVGVDQVGRVRLHPFPESRARYTKRCGRTRNI